MSDEDSSTISIKSQSFTLNERKLLLRLVHKHYDVVTLKKVDAKSVNQKNEAWEAIHDEFSKSAEVRVGRSSQQLKRCWENLKRKAKTGDFTACKLLKWAEDLPQNDNFTEVFDNNKASDDEEFDDEVEGAAFDEKCEHCSCDKRVRLHKMNQIKMDKDFNTQLFNIKIKHMKAKAKRDQELHRLAVHELTLRVENERRRAEILDKELSRFC